MLIQGYSYLAFNVYTAVFWDATPRICCLHLQSRYDFPCSNDEGSMFYHHACNYLPHYTMLQSRRLHSSHLIPWEPQTSSLCSEHSGKILWNVRFSKQFWWRFLSLGCDVMWIAFWYKCVGETLLLPYSQGPKQWALQRGRQDRQLE